MKISELWLSEWVSPPLMGSELADQLTMAGLEVDGVHPVAGEFDHVIVAKVLRTAPHKEADRLTVCEVDTGNAVIPVVCGAANVRSGLKVALALPGANLPGGLRIKLSKLRGEPSEGMLCSSTELGLEAVSEGIMELDEDAPIGSCLRTYLSLNDAVLDIDLTPNRADCFSVLGIAREVAALNQVPLRALPSVTRPLEIQDELSIRVEATDACPQYLGRLIRGIDRQAVTPLWMKERLRRSGVRLVHPVVDVTNYVLFELGQPMHAFDLNRIKGGLTVRYAREAEQLLLIEGQSVSLDEQVLVIADEQMPLALAGIMGGRDSAVSEETTDIYLESAYFNPLTVAGVARRFGLSSDGSQRFERGVDPALQRIALERATDLLVDMVGGQVGPITTIIHTDALPVTAPIVFHPSKVAQWTGLQLPEEEMKQHLLALGMTIVVHSGHWLISVPSYRFDLSLEVDIVEEITRLHGYDQITADSLMGVVKAGRVAPHQPLLHHMATCLCHRGYHETISYSFVDPLLQTLLYPEFKSLSLLNPISQELSAMRISLWPGLLASAVYNVHRQQTVLKLFETGVIFDRQGDDLVERKRLAGLLTGEQGALNWSEATRSFDFFDLKGDVQAMLEGLSYRELDFVAATHPALHPGKAARVMLGEQLVGWIGALHPRLLDELDLTDEVLLFELDLDVLSAPPTVRYQAISKYPQIRRDLSLVVPMGVVAADIEKTIRRAFPNPWLKSIDIFDVYQGDAIPVGKKSVAVALTLQDDHRTLVDTEIHSGISVILQALDDTYTITLRD